MDKDSNHQKLNNEKASVPFTARLIAHYRAQENKRDNPLIVDPYAEKLVGDLTSYVEAHKRTAGQIDYAIVRTYYIENNLLTSWCTKYKKSQVVILGAGLDTRAYRFTPFQTGDHTIFEIDFPIVIKYKEQILQNEKPLCRVVRLPTDLSDTKWKSQLNDAGFSSCIPTFWILEGLVYYLKKDEVASILRKASKISEDRSEIFVDICIPIFADLRYGPFTMHFKWGLDEEDVPLFFSASGWSVTWSYADDHDEGRDVGQKGMMFVHGLRDISGISDMPNSTAYESNIQKLLKSKELKDFAKDLIIEIIPEVESIVEIFIEDIDKGLKSYLKFIKNTKPSLERITRGFKNPLSLGNISPRLLSDPHSITRIQDFNSEETESFVTGFLKAILQLLYCAAKGLEGDQYIGTTLHEESIKQRDSAKIISLLSLVQILKQELYESS